MQGLPAEARTCSGSRRFAPMAARSVSTAPRRRNDWPSAQGVLLQGVLERLSARSSRPSCTYRAPFLGQPGAVERSQPPLLLPAVRSRTRLRLVKCALARREVPEAGVCLGLDGSDPMPGREGTVASLGHSRGGGEGVSGLPIPVFVHVDVRMPDERASPQVVGPGVLAG